MEAKEMNQIQTLQDGSIDYNHYADAGALARNTELKRLLGSVNRMLPENRATLSTIASVVLLVILF